MEHMYLYFDEILVDFWEKTTFFVYIVESFFKKKLKVLFRTLILRACTLNVVYIFFFHEPNYYYYYYKKG